MLTIQKQNILNIIGHDHKLTILIQIFYIDTADLGISNHRCSATLVIKQFDF